VLNDYNLEQSGPDQDARRNAILELLNRLVQVGAPVHALGIQGHIDPKSSAFDPMGLQRFVRDVAGLGLDFYVTELDILDRRMDADIGLRDAEVAEAFGTFLRILLTERAVKLVSFWGLGDQQSWMNSSPYTRRRDGLRSRGHLYDDAWHRKPAWHAVAASLRQRPLVSKGQL
jgi:endo-1,4-beta-xylanase